MKTIADIWAMVSRDAQRSEHREHDQRDDAAHYELAAVTHHGLDVTLKKLLRKVPTQDTFDTLTRRSRRRLAKLCKDLAENRIGVGEWQMRFADELRVAHAGSFAMGRQLGGDMAVLEEDDFAYLDMRGILTRQYGFLAGFAADIDSGRYTVPELNIFDGPAIARRAMHYTQIYGGTANEAFVVTSEALNPGELFDWHMLTEEHCEDCPRYAAGGPYTASTLPTYPRSGETACRMNCGCVLVRKSDNRIGFARVYDDPILR